MVTTPAMGCGHNREGNKIINELSDLLYKSHLRACDLMPIEIGRERADLTEMFNIMKSNQVIDPSDFFTKNIS